MGFNPGLLDQFVDWAKKFEVKPGARVLDIGTSELFCAEDPSSINRFLTHFGVEPYTEDELALMANRGFAADLFQRAGLAYTAIDIKPLPRTLSVDLNMGRMPPWHRRRYNVVMNSGTTEHVLNQYNAFRLIHDACKVGGLMYHGVPMAGGFSHGLINYNPRFFTRLQEANGYEILGRWIWTSEEMRSYDEIELAAFNRPFASQDAFVHFLFRRRDTRPFRAPLDCVDYSPPALARSG
jgi:hypothetical protein